MRNQRPKSASRYASNNIESHLIEKRVFNPPKAFSLKADVPSFGQYQKLYRKSIGKPEEFWSQHRWSRHTLHKSDHPGLGLGHWIRLRGTYGLQGMLAYDYIAIRYICKLDIASLQ